MGSESVGCPVLVKESTVLWLLTPSGVLDPLNEVREYCGKVNEKENENRLRRHQGIKKKKTFQYKRT